MRGKNEKYYIGSSCKTENVIDELQYRFEKTLKSAQTEYTGRLHDCTAALFLCNTDSIVPCKKSVACFKPFSIISMKSWIVIIQYIANCCLCSFHLRMFHSSLHRGFNFCQEKVFNNKICSMYAYTKSPDVVS